ncbi:hypothetical protein A3Q56_07747 [Intoshia linei]|uniref:Uncharacterized protein n=1 Tax=Intoshia linei TaxID=1819745 RepID=A0A177ARC6_9BILA|nr:hypothetical protein A3Q56_07747 [Intoshia linei]
MQSIGNGNLNEILESKTVTKPTVYSSREDKETYIIDKYSKRIHLKKLKPSNLTIQNRISDAIVQNDIPELLTLIYHCAPDALNKGLNVPIDDRTPLHIAATLGNVSAVQLLIWAQANVNMCDQNNKAPIWYAKSANHMNCVRLLDAACDEIR